MPKRALVFFMVFVCMPLVAATESGGGATPQEAYQRLVDAAKARDVVAMTTALDPDSRAMLLRDMLVGLATVANVPVNGVTPNAEHAQKLLENVVKIIGPALEANPIDPAFLEGHSQTDNIILTIGWGISKVPLRDAQTIARMIKDEMRNMRQDWATAAIDDFVKQIPTAALKINKQTADQAWAIAGDHPLGFAKIDGRWYAGGVWYSNTKIPIVPAPQATIIPAPADKLEPVTAAELKAGPPLKAIEAYAQLKAVTLAVHPDARLRELQTGAYPVNATGGSSGWFATFLTNTPGELTALSYEGGKIIAPHKEPIREDAKAISDESKTSFDLQRVLQLARQAAAELPKGARTTAILMPRNTGEPVWLVLTFDDQGHVLHTVAVDAYEMNVLKVTQH